MRRHLGLEHLRERHAAGFAGARADFVDAVPVVVDEYIAGAAADRADRQKRPAAVTQIQRPREVCLKITMEPHRHGAKYIRNIAVDTVTPLPLGQP